MVGPDYNDVANARSDTWPRPASRRFHRLAAFPFQRASDKLSLKRQALKRQAGPLGEHEEDTQVAKKGHSEEEILRALRQAEGGSRVAEICREHGINEATFYIYGRLPLWQEGFWSLSDEVDCKHLFGVIRVWCAQMGNSLTLASTTGRPRGPM